MDGEVINLKEEQKKSQEIKRKKEFKNIVNQIVKKFVEYFFMCILSGIALLIAIGLIKTIIIGLTLLVNWLFHLKLTPLDVILGYLCLGIIDGTACILIDAFKGKFTKK